MFLGPPSDFSLLTFIFRTTHGWSPDFKADTHSGSTCKMRSNLPGGSCSVWYLLGLCNVVIITALLAQAALRIVCVCGEVGGVVCVCVCVCVVGGWEVWCVHMHACVCVCVCGRGGGEGLEDLIVPSVRLGSRELVLSGQGCLGQKARWAEASEPRASACCNRS